MEITPDLGVRLGGLELHDRVAGVGFKTIGLTGWDEPTASTGTIIQRAGASGGYPDEAHSMGRRLVWHGSINSHSHAESLAMLAALWRALPVADTTPFVVTDLGVPRHVPVRQEDKPDADWLTDTHISVNFQLQSDEWRRLAGDGLAPAHSITVGLPYTSGGRVLPYTLPSAIDATTVSGSVQVANAGDAKPAAAVLFTGPVPSPTVRMPDGQSMTFEVDVLPGQELYVDFDTHEVLLNGVSRSGSRRGAWLQFAPGDNTLIFDAASYNADARMTVLWSDSWK